MTEPTEPRPLKRTIPPDVQENVEDIQKTILRTTKHRPLKRAIPPDLQKQIEDIQKKIQRTTGLHQISRVMVLVIH